MSSRIRGFGIPVTPDGSGVVRGTRLLLGITPYHQPVTILGLIAKLSMNHHETGDPVVNAVVWSQGQ